jgi:alanine racemase
MTLRLTIDEAGFDAHVGAIRRAVPALIPVVKGNGYGYGRVMLARRAAGLATQLAVGTASELAGLDSAGRGTDGIELLVLTPAVHLDGVVLPSNAVPTVGHTAHLDALLAHRWSGGVSVKLASSMHRYGVLVAELPALIARIDESGLELRGHLLHMPLAGNDRNAARSEADSTAEIEAWLPHLDPAVALSVSHLSPTAFASLVERHPRRSLSLRVGTALWHGDKSFLRLQADVVDLRPVRAGDRAGYRATTIGAAATLVMVGAGSAHGVTELAGALSPFHHQRRRLALLEPPHMHTSMLCVPSGEPTPAIGDWLDVQRPLTSITADEVVWS